MSDHLLHHHAHAPAAHPEPCEGQAGWPTPARVSHSYARTVCQGTLMNDMNISVKLLSLQLKQHCSRKVAGLLSPSPMQPSAASWAALLHLAQLTCHCLPSHQPKAGIGTTSILKKLSVCKSASVLSELIHHLVSLFIVARSFN